jgi:quinoprotein dehydrogenase-associated probable ABC transporter substrate-binding protein
MMSAVLLAVAAPAADPTVQTDDSAKSLYEVRDGNEVDAVTLQGWKTWRALACERCHGPAQEGLVGPALVDSLKRLTKDAFFQTIMNGRIEKGMPPFNSSAMVTKNWEGLYAYLKGRSDGKILPGRLTLAAPTLGDQEGDVLRVCADPYNLPLSNDHGEGYENRIAAKLAHDLGRRVEYTFFPQRMGFVRNTLRKKDEVTQRYACDLIIGVPKGYELTATTRPYLHSTYAMVFRAQGELKLIESPDDLLKLPPAQRRALRVGIFARSPAADWLLRNELFDQAVFYAQQSGDPHENPAVIVERDLEAGKFDVAIVWGPVAGFLVRRHAGQGAWRAAAFKPDPRIKFDYEISMGVRFGEEAWKDTLDTWIAGHRREIDEILMSYQIPLIDDQGKLVAPAAMPFGRK